MGFSCIKDEEVIYSFQYKLPEWIALKEGKSSSFKMPCCGEDAILKTSRLGTQFFAHKPSKTKVKCAPSKESPEHTHIKYLVSRELYEQGWQVEVEKTGQSPDGETWMADVYAEKGDAKIAIEVQWSPQSFIETKRRHEIYAKSGVRCVWLLRSTSKKSSDAIVADYAYNTKKMPVFSIYRNARDKDSEYMVYNILSKVTVLQNVHSEECSLSVTDFIGRLVNKKIIFKPLYADYCNLNLSIVNQNCWRCGASTNSVRTINIEDTRYGYTSAYLVDRTHISDIDYDEHASFVDFINQNYAEKYNFKPLRNRYSKTEQGYYVANSCISCDALMGSTFLRTVFRASDGFLTHNSFVSLAEHDDRDREVGRWFLKDDS